MSAELLFDDREGAVALLRLNRPASMNALDGALVEALGTALARAAADDNVRAIVLTGEGGSFCSGADLKDALAALGAGVALETRLAAFQSTILTIANARQPV